VGEERNPHSSPKRRESPVLPSGKKKRTEEVLAEFSATDLRRYFDSCEGLRGVFTFPFPRTHAGKLRHPSDMGQGRGEENSPFPAIGKKKGGVLSSLP